MARQCSLQRCLDVGHRRFHDVSTGECRVPELVLSNGFDGAEAAAHANEHVFIDATSAKTVDSEDQRRIMGNSLPKSASEVAILNHGFNKDE